ncbi:MAG: L,D-transpeptidase family protein [Alphaproteobacteria bacterium]|nr:L,D-transpeptidase family protein [Alphaproteobacteria bacterium]
MIYPILIILAIFSQTSPVLSAAPPFPQAHKLTLLIEKYQKDIADDSSPWPQWTCLQHSFRLGEKDPALSTTKQQLKRLGFLVESKDIITNPIYDAPLEKAIRQFQLRHFIEPDGIIGKKTCTALNMSLQERIRKIKLNLDRLGKLKFNQGERYVLVNIPTYQAYAMEGYKAILSQPVIVGMRSRQTPVFKSTMNSVTLNPSWGVPVSIFVRDKLRRVLDDPSYLDNHGYVVTDSDGQPLYGGDVNWAHVSMQYFPYRVRQLPGKHNALGAIKFNLDNKHAIYLHSTPDQKLFQKTSRALSSGCVRLSAPSDLAVWALGTTPSYAADKIDQLLKKETTHTLKLKDRCGFISLI